PVATAESQERPPETALQVAFTWAGLGKLGLPSNVLAGFSPEFQSGMAGEENRSRRLGHVGANAPEAWWWRYGGSIPDVLVMLFALPGKLDERKRTLQDNAWDAAFELIRCLDTTDMGGHEPFGFKDGISQPCSNLGARQQLAESMVGRTMEGQPLAQLSAVPIPGIGSDPKDDPNRFTFDQDPAGTRCPFGTHIRRANPRNTDYPNRPSWWLARWLSMLGWASRLSRG